MNDHTGRCTACLYHYYYPHDPADDGACWRCGCGWDEVLREAVQDQVHVMTFTEAVGKLMRHSVRCPHCDGEVRI